MNILPNDLADDDHECVDCGDDIPSTRRQVFCVLCEQDRERSAKAQRQSWCVVPMPKSNYILVTDPALLQGLNSSHRGNR